AVRVGHGERVQEDVRVFVPSETDVAELAGLASLDERPMRAVFVEDAMRVFVSQHFMVLDEIDAVGLEAAQRLVELTRGLLGRSSIDLRQHEAFLTKSAAERRAHAPLAGAAIVVPAVVEKRDPAVDRGLDEAIGQRRADMWQREVPAAKADGRHTLARVAENASGNFAHVRLLAG